VELSVTSRNQAGAAWTLIASVSLCIVFAGCGGGVDSSGTVSGDVRIDGTAVPRGFITFSPTTKNQGPVVGAPIEEGKYRCDRVPLGNVTVTFVAQAAEPTIVFDVANKTNHEIPKNILPPQYSAGIPVEVTAGANHRDFDLKNEATSPSEQAR
jgi:hypothetical protein